MNSLSLVVLLVTVAVASASLYGLGLGHAGVVAGHGSPAVIAGPSGSVIRGGVSAGHVGIAGHGLGLGLGAGLIGAHGAGIAHSPLIVAGGNDAVKIIAPAGSGLEGQWVPDINEHLYDDGQYRPWAHGHGHY